MCETVHQMFYLKLQTLPNWECLIAVVIVIVAFEIIIVLKDRRDDFWCFAECQSCIAIHEE